jgi:glyoxalase family protein
MQIPGFHHLTAVSADASGNHAFYTGVLGLRLVKKTVNQDDVSAYHLFYADGKASPGSDITFFDWPVGRERRGTNSIARTGFRVAAGSLDYWAGRLQSKIINRGERQTIEFEDPEGQRLSIVADDREGPAHPWAKSPVPAEHQIRGLGPITLSVPTLPLTDKILTRLMEMRPTRQFSAPPSDASAGESIVHVYEMGDGGAHAELQVAVEPDLPAAEQGAGAVHHVAFRVPTVEEYEEWNQRLQAFRVPSSGPVDRYYFRSLYFREPNGILFELATDGPGFATDESMEHLGENLALPPFLEPRRAQIEAGLKPLRT